MAREGAIQISRRCETRSTGRKIMQEITQYMKNLLPWEKKPLLFFYFNGSLCQGPIVCSLRSIERLFNAQSDNSRARF